MTSCRPDSHGRPRPGGELLVAGRSVARIGYGAAQLRRHRSDPDAGKAVLRRAIELGVDHIDTAQFYGDGSVNALVCDVVGEDPAIVVATKVGATPDPDGPYPMRPAQRPEELRDDLELNLRTLNRDSIPLVYLRRLDVGPGLAATGDQVVDLDDQLAEMIAMRDEGKIGAIGLSAVTEETVRAALPAAIASVQNPYSLVDRRFEGCLELCTAERIAWVPFFPLGSPFGSLPKVTDRPPVVDAARVLGVTAAQVGLAWLLGHAPNIGLIPGTADVDHLAANVEVGAITLDPSVRAELDRVGASTRGAEIDPPTVADQPTEPRPDAG